MHIIADVNKVSKIVPGNLTFILNVLSESSNYFAQLSIKCCYFHIKGFFIEDEAVLLCATMRERAKAFAAAIYYTTFWYSFTFFVVHFLNAFWHGNETIPKVSSQNETVRLVVVFHLPYSKYKGVKISFYSCRYRHQNFSLVSHSCRSCSTRVALVLQSCCSFLALVS